MLTHLQNKIENVGNIHPEYRIYKPLSFNKKIQDRFNQTKVILDKSKISFFDIPNSLLV